jgi:hypothetical protein
MSLWRARLLLISATIMVTSACTGDSGGPTSAAQGTAPSSEPQQATVVAVDYRYADAPTELRAGVINMRFENHGTVDHEMALTDIGDTSFDEWTKWLGGGNGLGAPVPEYVDRFAVPSAFLGLKPDRSAESTFILTPGRYVMWCSYTQVAKGDEEAAHYQLGMIRELIVTDGVAEPELPEADGTITATDYALDVDVDAGDRTINFINEGPVQAHWSTVEEYPEGVDAAEAEEAFRAQLEPGPTPKGFPEPRGLGFSGIFSEGLGGTFELSRGELEAGRTYVFACYMTDRDGRHQHAKAYDMYRIVTLE